MNKRELAKAVAVHADVDLKTTSAVLEGFTEVVTAVVSQGEPVAITGFAKFVKVNRPARMGRNPATGEAIRIKASKKARITPVKAFKDAVMAPATAPRLKRGAFPTSDDAVRAAGKTVAAATPRPARPPRRARPPSGPRPRRPPPVAPLPRRLRRVGPPPRRRRFVAPPRRPPPAGGSDTRAPSRARRRR